MMKILSSFKYPQVVPNRCKCLCWQHFPKYLCVQQSISRTSLTTTVEENVVADVVVDDVLEISVDKNFPNISWESADLEQLERE